MSQEAQELVPSEGVQKPCQVRRLPGALYCPWTPSAFADVPDSVCPAVEAGGVLDSEL